MNVARWTPFSDFESVLRDYNRTGQGLRRADWVPLVDVRESESAYLIDVEVPAVASEDLTVSVAENMLTVTGKSQIAENDHAENYYRSERRRGSFSRRFRLPRDADAELISAETKDGVLYLQVPKKAETIARNIEVKTGD